MDSNIGYSYGMPSESWSFRLRNTMTQFSDLFSEFNKYISPAYHHDRCERYIMHFILLWKYLPAFESIFVHALSIYVQFFDINILAP